MPSIQPQVEFKINLRCVEFERQPAYPRRMDKKTIGEQIKEALERKGLSQTDLAERCDVSNNAVSKWIKTGKVSKANIPSVCLHTGLDAGIFLGAEDDLAVAVRLPEIRPAAGVAETLRLSIQAIAEKWGIKDARDLLDPSPEAKERVEHAISTAAFRTVAAKPKLKELGDDDTPAMFRSD
jgi:transcriptional regulator with XRE-family HTH domain